MHAGPNPSADPRDRNLDGRASGRGAVTGREVLAGLVERVTFHNPDNGFCVLRIKARGHRDLLTAVGHAAMISAGEWITASGEWANDRTHGLQFRARFLRASAPSSLKGIEKYLGSGMIRGIGPAYAKRMVRLFGKDVFDIIEASPERLREVEGIGPKRAGRITTAWADQKMIREIMAFLHQHGVGTARAVRIFKTYGADAVEVMSENPYRLARDIRGIGFRTADLIAEKLGIEKTAMIRVRAGISFALAEAMSDGHCGLPETDLKTLAVKLLEVPEDLIASALEMELAEQTVAADSVAGTPCVFLSGHHHAESAVAGHLRRLTGGPLPWPEIDSDKALPWVEARTGLIAFIDDATRVIPFAAFAAAENIQAFLPVFRNALIRRGIPQRLYVDNGSNYRSRQLSLVCAKLGIALIHARPHHPAGKGKIERWFRTLRAGWLAQIDPEALNSLQTLNRSLWAWIEGEYHHTPHRGLQGRTPLEQWALAGAAVRYPDATLDLEEVFLFEARRRVHKDRTVSLNGQIYEVDPILVGEHVILRYDPEAPPTRPLGVVHQGKPAGLATRLDAYANTAVKRANATGELEAHDPAPEPPPSPLSLRNLMEDD